MKEMPNPAHADSSFWEASDYAGEVVTRVGGLVAAYTAIVALATENQDFAIRAAGTYVVCFAAHKMFEMNLQRYSPKIDETKVSLEEARSKTAVVYVDPERVAVKSEGLEELYGRLDAERDKAQRKIDELGEIPKPSIFEKVLHVVPEEARRHQELLDDMNYYQDAIDQLRMGNEIPAINGLVALIEYNIGQARFGKDGSEAALSRAHNDIKILAKINPLQVSEFKREIDELVRKTLYSR